MPCKIELSDGRVFDESEFYSWLLDGGYDELISKNILTKQVESKEPTKPKGELRKSGFQERSLKQGMEGFVKELAENNDAVYIADNQEEQLAKAKEKFGSYELYLENKADLLIGQIVTDPQIQIDRQVALFYISLEGDIRRKEGRGVETLADEATELMNTIAETARMGGQLGAATVWRFMTPGMAGIILNRSVKKANAALLDALKDDKKAEVEALKEKIADLEKFISEQKAETKKRNKAREKKIVEEIVSDVDAETLGMITKGVKKDASEAVKKKVNSFFDKLLANENGPVMATIVPITPKMYNAFVNVVRKAVLSGIDLGTALNNASAGLIRNKEVTPAQATELRKKFRETIASMKEKKAPTEAQIERKKSAEDLKAATQEFNAEKELSDLIQKERERQAKIREKEEQKAIDAADRENFRLSQKVSKEAVALEEKLRLEKQELSRLRREERERQAKIREKEEQRVRDLSLKEEIKRAENAVKEREKEIEKFIKQTIQDVKTQLGKSKSDIGKDLTIEDFVQELIEEYKSMDPTDKTTNQRLINLVKSKLDVSDQTARTIATKIMKGIVSTKRALDIESEEKIKQKIKDNFANLYGKSVIPGAKKREVKKDFDKILEGIENGVLNDSFYRALFLEKFGLKPELTPSQIFELERLQRVVSSLPPGSRLYNQAVVDMGKYIEELYPPDFMADLFDSIVALNYVNQLSSAFTQFTNITSNINAMIMSPLGNLINLNIWARALRKGLKDMDYNTFIAYSPLTQLRYLPIGYAKGIKVGSEYFMDTMTNGQINEKFVEGLKSQAGKIKIGRTERNKYGEGLAYPPIKLFGVEIAPNPYNYAKYVPRFMNATDMLFFGTDYTATVMSYAARKAARSGLKGKALDNAVRDAIREAYGKINEVEIQLENEVRLYEMGGKKLDEHIKKVRKSEIITDNLLKVFNVTQEEKVEIINLSRGRTFTSGIRRGAISQIARVLNYLINMNRGTQFVLKPFIPFVNVIAELTEFGLDHVPVYGHVREMFGGVSGIVINPIAKGLTGKDIGSAQLGEKGSMLRDEQLSRAWFGTMVFTAAVLMFAGTDEDDELQLTGGYSGERKQRKFGREQSQMPAYAIRYKDNIIIYKDIPGLNILLGLIGNYNDSLQYSKYSKDELNKRMALAIFYSLRTTAVMVKDMSYMSSLNDFLSQISDASSAEMNKVEKVFKAVFAKYTGFLLKPLPQNNQMLLHIEGMFTHTAYSRREYDDILIYSAGLQHFMGKPSIDIFGEEVQSFPASGSWPYAHYFDLFEKRSYLGFSLKYNALQPKILNQVVKVYDAEKGEFVERDMSGQEFIEFCKLAGKKYKEKVLLYMAKTDAEKRVKEIEDEKNGVDFDLNKLHSQAKDEAKDEMFIYPYINQESLKKLKELKAIKAERKEMDEQKKKEVLARIKENVEFSQDDESVAEVLLDASNDKAAVFLDISEKKGFKDYNSIVDYAKKFAKVKVLSKEDVSEIAQAAKAYE